MTAPVLGTGSLPHCRIDLEPHLRDQQHTFYTITYYICLELNKIYSHDVASLRIPGASFLIATYLSVARFSFSSIHPNFIKSFIHIHIGFRIIIIIIIIIFWMYIWDWYLAIVIFGEIRSCSDSSYQENGHLPWDLCACQSLSEWRQLADRLLRF